MQKPDVKWSDAPVWKSIDCGEGWWPIIAELDSHLRVYPNYKVVQVKEKFGGLRFYADGVDEKGYELIGAAERLASVTCEVCGKPGRLRDDRSWVRTLCDEHAASPPLRDDDYTPEAIDRTADE